MEIMIICSKFKAVGKKIVDKTANEPGKYRREMK